MANKFGLTWWGKRWLNALDKIDYDNRLPRGRRYANNGSVKSIKIQKNTISARVDGSRPQPYKVDVQVPMFSAEEKEALKSEIKLNVQVFAALLNKELSPDIEGIALNNGIHLFPERWTDFTMSCSCPDWAVPCKHLAAVIYKVGEAIDRDPWLFFQLKGLDLQKDMEGLRPAQTAIVFHQPSDFFMPEFPAYYALTPAPSEVSDLELSTIPFLRGPMYSLLRGQPLFWKEDFREEWDDRLATTAKNLKRWLENQDSEATFAVPELQKGSVPQLFLDADMVPSVVGLSSKRSQKVKAAHFQDLLLALFQIQRDALPDFHENVEALWHVLNFCQVLIARSAIRPMLLQTDEGAFRIIWMPALSAPEVATLLDQLNAVIPADLIFKLDPDVATESYLPALTENKALVLCSVFLEMLIGEFSVDTPAYSRQRRALFEPPTATRDPILDLFFGGMAVEFGGFEAESIPAAIQKWLDIFELGSQKIRPLLEIIEKEGEDFCLQLLLENVEGDDIAPLSLADFLSSADANAAQSTVLRALHVLATLIPPIHDLMRTGGKKPVPIEPTALLEILLDKLPLVQLLGVQVLLPNALKSLIRPKVTVKIDGMDFKKDSPASLGSLFGFSWEISVGDESLSPDDFLSLLHTTHGLVKIRNQYVLIQPDELERLRKRIERGPAPSPQQLVHAALTGEFEGSKATLTPAAAKLVKTLKDVKKIPVPASIKAELRPYQSRGYAWMYKNTQLGLGSVIADDMGLGKTLQVITLLEKLRIEGRLKSAPALVIVPTSLLINWKKEVEKFAPDLRIAIFHGTNRKLPEAANFDLIVTTYGTVRGDLKRLQTRKWSVLIIDEAQNIKNADTAQSKSIRSIPAAVHIAMSGTPVENRLSDYWSILEFALPGYLGTKQQFREEFAGPITNLRDPDALRLFQGITAPFVMRRVKTDPNVISDLPDKLSHNQWCSLENEQAAIYQNVVEESWKAIQEAEDEISRKGLILKMLTALKQVCNHPAQYLRKGKIQTQYSGKAAALVPILENIVQQHEKCLIFTQYKEMGTMLQHMLRDEMGIEASFLHGGLNSKQREALVTEFQEEAHRKVFILSTKAGGTGLNLTAANHVIHYDLWWNPAVENQATDRAFRIGQKKNVMVHRLICKGTLEERIDNMLKAKQELADLTVTQGESWIGALSNTDLKRLVAWDAEA